MAFVDDIKSCCNCSRYITDEMFQCFPPPYPQTLVYHAQLHTTSYVCVSEVITNIEWISSSSGGTIWFQSLTLSICIISSGSVVERCLDEVTQSSLPQPLPQMPILSSQLVLLEHSSDFSGNLHCQLCGCYSAQVQSLFEGSHHKLQVGFAKYSEIVNLTLSIHLVLDINL